MADLSDATIDELYGEIRSRFDFCILACQGLAKTSDDAFVYFRWSPGIIEAWGLLRMADHVLDREYGSTFHDPDEGDTPIAGD